MKQPEDSKEKYNRRRGVDFKNIESQKLPDPTMGVSHKPAPKPGRSEVK